jgi:hypothetical protein
VSGGEQSWAGAEMEVVDLGDKRLNRRVIRLLARLGEKPTLSIPAACRGWAETQAAYRFFDNEKVSAERVLAPHIEATRERMRGEAVILCITDTTELDYSGKKDIRGLGPLTYEAQRGMYLHASLAVTTERLSLGVLDALFWARDPAGYGKSSEQADRPIEEKESIRWLESYRTMCEHAAKLPQTQLVYVTDREGDIYDIFAESESREEPKADWLIRSQTDRNLADGGKLWQRVAAAEPLGEVEFDLPASKDRKARHVVQTLRVARVRLKAPYRTGTKLPDVEITAVYAREDDPPRAAERIEWILLTSLPVESFEEAREILQWYLCRWQIEVFFRILKSGCEVEELQLEITDRLEPAIALFLIVAWRVMFLTMLGRTAPDLPCDAVFATEEWQAVYIVAKHSKPPKKPPSLNSMIHLVATFGGFLDRKGDGEPGPKTLWIGLQRARDFVIAVAAARSVDPTCA